MMHCLDISPNNIWTANIFYIVPSVLATSLLMGYKSLIDTQIHIPCKEYFKMSFCSFYFEKNTVMYLLSKLTKCGTVVKLKKTAQFGTCGKLLNFIMESNVEKNSLTAITIWY